MMMMPDVAKIRQSRQVAVLRHVILHQRSTYCARRLLRDLKQIQDNTIPTVGVSGHPLQKDLKRWHANIRGPQSTPYQGGVFHLELSFPDNYPHNPPQVKLLTPIPEHPFALENGTKVCLDMLQTGSNYNKGLYSGWTSGYSVLSILLQLQSFLFELPHDLKAMEPQIRKRVKEANQFVCQNPGCHHKGPIQAWPEFNKRESFLDAFIFTKSEKERLMEETCCFHNRLNLSETSLGVGISVTRLPRTGQIRTIECTLDLLSIKAYIKDSVRKCMSNGQKFTHWLPLYLGTDREKTLHFLRHSLSMICQNTTKKFDPQKHILAVLPKLLVTLAVSMMQEMTHTSIKALRMWTYFVRLFMLLLEQYPEVGKQIKRRVDTFLSSEEQRVKDKFSSLGDFLAYITISPDHILNGQILEAYLGQSLDRQVFWMLRDVPQLGEVQEKKGEVMDDKRDQVAFKTNMTSNHILLFFYNFNKLVMGKKQSLGKVLSQLDSHFCQLSEKLEDEFQKQCEQIRKVKDFSSFFAMLGMKQPSKKELTNRLKLAVMNSLRKKYHGEEEEINALPKTNLMMIQYQKKFITYKDFWDFNKGRFQVQNQNDTKWFNALKQRFDWIRQLSESGQGSDQLNPVNLAIMSDKNQIKSQGGNKISQKYDRLQKIKQQALTTDSDNMSVRDILYPEDRMWRSKYESFMNWRNLFLKLDLQHFLINFQYNPDFKSLNQYLDKCGPYIQFLQLPIISKADIKSGHYWIMVVLSKLPKLRGLTIYQKNQRVQLGGDGIKYLAKGINNMIQKSSSGCNLQLLQFNDVTLLDTPIFFQKFGSILRQLSSNLKILSLKNTPISLNLAKGIQKLLSDGRCLVQLYLINCQVGLNEAKQIADGLMRSKQIEVISLRNNAKIGHGINLLLYSLAFLPKIRHIDVSDVMANDRLSQIAQTLYKLLKMSGSLQTLILNRTDILNNLTNDFFKALGQNASLKHLFMDSNGTNTVSNTSYLGKVIAYNAYKKGSLELVSLKNRSIRNNYSFNNFISSMKISHRDHEYQYGDRSVADKMEGDDLVRQFYCNLKSLYISKGNLQSNFRLKNWEKQPTKQLPQLCTLFTRGKLLNFEMSDCNLNDKDADLLGLALSDVNCSVKALNLGTNNMRKEGAKILAQKLEQNNKIQALDLSFNKLGVSGSKSIAKMLESNKNIRFLNLYCNNMDVDGARSLKLSLSKNTTLQHLDVGYNRLRKKGLLALASGLFENKQSVLNSIGLRQNFLNDHCLQEFISLLNKNFRGNQLSLQRLFIKKNQISELCLNKIKSDFLKNNDQESKETKPLITIDAIDKMKHTVQDKLDRTIWVSPIKQHQTEGLIKLFFEVKKCGVVVDVRVREGSKVQGKPQGNRYAFVEFAHPTSVLRALKLAAKKKSIVQGVRVRIYKAGTKTFNNVKPKKSKSQSSIEKRTYGGQTLNLQKKYMRGKK